MHVLGTLKGPATCTDWLDFKSCFRLSHSVATKKFKETQIAWG